jgi:hypothetical protein
MGRLEYRRSIGIVSAKGRRSGGRRMSVCGRHVGWMNVSCVVRHNMVHAVMIVQSEVTAVMTWLLTVWRVLVMQWRTVGSGFRRRGLEGVLSSVYRRSVGGGRADAAVVQGRAIRTTSRRRRRRRWAVVDLSQSRKPITRASRPWRLLRAVPRFGRALGVLDLRDRRELQLCGFAKDGRRSD